MIFILKNSKANDYHEFAIKVSSINSYNYRDYGDGNKTITIFTDNNDFNFDSSNNEWDNFDEFVTVIRKYFCSKNKE